MYNKKKCLLWNLPEVNCVPDVEILQNYICFPFQKTFKQGCLRMSHYLQKLREHTTVKLATKKAVIKTATIRIRHQIKTVALSAKTAKVKVSLSIHWKAHYRVELFAFHIDTRLLNIIKFHISHVLSFHETMLFSIVWFS